MTACVILTAEIEIEMEIEMNFNGRICHAAVKAELENGVHWFLKPVSAAVYLNGKTRKSSAKSNCTCDALN